MAASITPFRFLSAVTCADLPAHRELEFTVRDYDLAATLACGQAFRWERRGERWTGVVQGRWVELRQAGENIFARTTVAQTDWDWLAEYLQIAVDFDSVLATFPEDEPMGNAVSACRGLRLLRQEPWECLASFIVSSTKQIVQIRQIISELCARHGEPVEVPPGEAVAFAFPSAARIAGLTEAQLRACKMGFRAPYLLATARRVAGGEFNLESLRELEVTEARERLLTLPGVGHKIADCVLLFAFGFPTAFPQDVWVMRALRQLYFRGRRTRVGKLREFAATHFGPNAGYAQQYLFHAQRLRERKKLLA